MAHRNADHLTGHLIPLLRRGGIVNWTVSKALGPTHAIVFALILDKIDQHGKAKIYNLLDYFLLRIKISKSTLKRVLKDLKKEGLINVERGVRQKNYYSLNAEGCYSFLKTHEKVTAQIDPMHTEGYSSNRPQKSNQRVKTKSNQNVSSRRPTRGGVDSSKPSLIFSKASEALLQHWIDSNLRRPSKPTTKNKALNAIHSALQHYSFQDVKKSITVYAELFERPHNRVTKLSSLWFSVDNFFSPDARTKEVLKKNFPNVVEHGSMFAICVEGAEYADEQFSTVKKADNPAMVKLVQKYVIQHTGIDDFSPKKISLMNGLANNLEEFWNDYHKRFKGYRMRNAGARPGGVVNVYFEFLKDSGIFSDQFKFHWINSRQRIDDFYEHLVYNDMLERRKSRRAKANATTSRTPHRQLDREGHTHRDDSKQRGNGADRRLSVRRRLQN